MSATYLECSDDGTLIGICIMGGLSLRIPQANGCHEVIFSQCGSNNDRHVSRRELPKGDDHAVEKETPIDGVTTFEESHGCWGLIFDSCCLKEPPNLEKAGQRAARKQGWEIIDTASWRNWSEESQLLKGWKIRFYSDIRESVVSGSCSTNLARSPQMGRM